MKKLFFVIVILFCASLSFAAMTTHTWYFGSTGYGFSDGTASLTDGILTTGYRGITCAKDYGFYYGSDIALGLPTIIIYRDSFGSIMDTSEDDFFMSIKVPLGYRWQGSGKSMGFYLGGAPVLQMLADFDTATIYSIGAVAELGWQTNKSQGLGFHFGFQLGFSPIIFSPGNGSISGLNASEAAFQFGMSWRRIKK